MFVRYTELASERRERERERKKEKTRQFIEPHKTQSQTFMIIIYRNPIFSRCVAYI